MYDRKQIKILKDMKNSENFVVSIKETDTTGKLKNFTPCFVAESFEEASVIQDDVFNHHLESYIQDGCSLGKNLTGPEFDGLSIEMISPNKETSVLSVIIDSVTRVEV